MKKLRLSSVTLLAVICAGSTFAADLPRKSVYKAHPPVATPAYNWTGFYAGLNAGGAWAREDETLVLTGNWVGRPEVPGIQSAGSQGLDPAGFTGGGQVGYNWQSGPAVLGIEADLNSLRLHKSRFLPNGPNASTDTFSLAASTESDWMATVRGRIGYAHDRLLLYFTGGLAVINRKFSQTLVQTNFAPGFVETGSASATKRVPIYGGGLEYALSNGWSLKGEYLYANLGELAFSSAASCPAPDTATCLLYTGNHSDRLRLNITRVGLNYKFDLR